MVARFDTGPSLRKILNYNEQKVAKGVAEFLTARNYPLDDQFLNFHHKLNRLENQAALNENVTRNTIHISLNFDPSERLEKDKLTAIADTYMDRLGLSDLPYLVYQHSDAGHPHIHIVSVKVRADGKRVETQNIGRNQSEKARKEIEIAFNLVKAEDSKNLEKYKLEKVNAQKVQYGKSETKRAISNVLKTVLDTYKYASLPELNALLKLYNIMADRGHESSTMYRNNGLVFRVLDNEGKKVGTPIKASSFYMQPTLKKLTEKFAKNEPLKKKLGTRIKNAIELALLRKPVQSLQALIKSLEKEGIATVLRQSVDGRIYGITYIDHKNKVVFNGSDLGKQYSAKAMQERFATVVSKTGERTTNDITAGQLQNNTGGNEIIMPFGQSMAEILLQQEYMENLPMELKKNRKRKRKRLSNNQ